jgi:hypothetical protein
MTTSRVHAMRLKTLEKLKQKIPPDFASPFLR